MSIVRERRLVAIVDDEKAVCRAINSSGPKHLPDVPPDSDVRYDYRYDNYFNWTERIQTGSDASSVTTRREITYY